MEGRNKMFSNYLRIDENKLYKYDYNLPQPRNQLTHRVRYLFYKLCSKMFIKENNICFCKRNIKKLLKRTKNMLLDRF